MSTVKTGCGFGGYAAGAGSAFGPGSGGGGAFGSGGQFGGGTFGGNENRPPTTSSTFGFSSGMGTTKASTGPSAFPITPPTGPKSLHGSPFVSTIASGGQTFRSANSVQYRPSPLGTSQMVAQNIDKRYYGTPRGPVVYGTGFQGTPYR
ncbi:hypothetical protein LTS10_011818 [Elasticomyces elasticus]|nr:hypothetical protein LTS10_011818 [Elasticomyces elasticus]